LMVGFPELVPRGITFIALTISLCSELRQDNQRAAAADYSDLPPKRLPQIGSATSCVLMLI